MKKIFGRMICFVAVALVTIIFLTNSHAIVMPTEIVYGPNEGAIGMYGPEDMGYFDNQDVWHWNDDFIATVMPTIGNMYIFRDWKEELKPTKTYMPPKMTDARFEKRVYPEEKQSRFSFAATTGGVEVRYPVIYLFECRESVVGPYGPSENSIDCTTEGAIAITSPNWPAPEGCNGNIDALNCDCAEKYPQYATTNDPNCATHWNPWWIYRDAIDADPSVERCCRRWPHQTFSKFAPEAVVTADQVQSVKWVEKNLFATPRRTEDVTYIQVSYNPELRFWNNQTATPFSYKNISYYWPGVVPSEDDVDQDQTIEVKLVGGLMITGKAKTKSVRNLPGIPTIVEQAVTNPAGKVMPKKMIAVKNIVIREIPDAKTGLPALVVQWPEPDEVLFGGLPISYIPYPAAQFQAKLYVGATEPDSMAGSREVFLWIDFPPQSGSVIVRSNHYQLIKDMLSQNGFTPSDLRVMIHYREMFYEGPISDGFIPYQNRGASNLVPVAQ